MSEEGQVIEFNELINHPNYEMLNVYPFTIRNINVVSIDLWLSSLYLTLIIFHT